ncbi:MAG TPA: serine hydrolase [Puia sp.]|nr:serine hydrolase [Puia sp.]
MASLKSFHQIFFTGLLAFFSVTVSFGQRNNPSFSPAVEKDIKNVENSLSGWVQIADSTNHWSLRERMKYYKVNGVSIAVIHHYSLEWARGYGFADSLEQRPVTTHTLFQAASISKSLHAIGVLNLVQSGKIDLDEDINKYLKSWRFPYDTVAKKKIITIRNLLSHTAGLTVHGFPGYEQGDTIPTIVQILDGKRPANTSKIRSQFAPGLRFEYSGGGTTISQLIVTDITGEAYDQYQSKNVLLPMGMTESFYSQPPPADKLSLLAAGYRENGEQIKGKFHIYPEMAAAGLWTNPSDLAKYIMETQLSWEGKSSKVLSGAMTKIRLTPFDTSTNAALGVFIDKRGGKTYFQHGGANEGFRCQYYGSLDSGDGIAVMVNSDNGAIMQEIINSVAAVYGWKDFYKPVIKKTVLVPNHILDTYTGNYAFNNSSIVINRNGDHLFLSQDNNAPVQLDFTSDTEFFMFEIPADCRFVKNETGKTISISVTQNGNQFSIMKKE